MAIILRPLLNVWRAGVNDYFELGTAGKRAPLARRALGDHVAAMFAKDLSAHRQTEARSFRTLGAHDGLKISANFSGANPGPLSTTRNHSRGIADDFDLHRWVSRTRRPHPGIAHHVQQRR